MGLFDSKEVKEAKRIYKQLLEIQNDSKELRYCLPKTEKEFLSSPQKSQMIEKYNHAVQVMGDTDTVNKMGINNLGTCYDFVSGHYNSYSVRKSMGKISESFDEHLRGILDSEVSVKQANEEVNTSYVKSTEEADKFVNDMESRISSLSSSPGYNRSMDIAREEAVKFVETMLGPKIETKEETLNNSSNHNDSVDKFYEEFANGMFGHEKGLAELSFHAKFLNYRRLSSYVFEGKKEPDIKFYDIFDALVKKTKDTRYPDMIPEDLLTPYILEKKHMEIPLSEKEIDAAARVLMDERMAEKLDFYIKINAIIFGNPNLPTKSFLDLFENCNERYLNQSLDQNTLNQEGKRK